MTDQPRDLAAEVEEIRALCPTSTNRAKGFAHWYQVETLLLHIAELERELEEATQAGIDTAREVSDTLSGRIDELDAEVARLKSKANNDALSMELQRDQALRECGLLHEALRWALDEFIVATSDGMFTDGEYNKHVAPPAHLAPILAEAMREKS